MYDPRSATGKHASIPGSLEEEAVTYNPFEFDPESTFVDDDVDVDTLALRDAMRDIYASEGRFELLL
jgi:hypothetical protein